ncbi:MAG: complex I subunit 5 family protein [Candidatus Omnitrophica bacterium]|nr:complex I subunit 5 family protein [Candidatus Omnitrophota bacterium]
MFKLDPLSSFVLLAIFVFCALVVVYSLGFMKGRKQNPLYYSYILITTIASCLAVLSNNFILLLACWGFLGLLLYLLIIMGGPQAAPAAKKAFCLVGGTDVLMVLGVGILYYLTGTFRMDNIKIPLAGQAGILPVIAYLCIAAGCFAKAGLMPFHTWIPDCAEAAPLPAVAFLPASLDKLLGIYLLARVSLDIFVMNQAMNMFLMLIGAFTIIAAVMMAMVQHNLKRLLGYHAVSQVGYMVLGIGTGNPIGIAGGLFHMFNNAAYKSCLFFAAGNVEYRKKTTELDNLGGLAKSMPITYLCCIVASLSISGVPPFNGFVSKWMIYQGLISGFTSAGSKFQILVSAFCLVAAMFGSGLTLASFIKLLHAVFLGQQEKPGTEEIKGEVSWTMWLPCCILAAVCVIFGIFAYQIPLKIFIYPVVGSVLFLGTWQAVVSILLVVTGLFFGLWAFNLSRNKFVMRKDSAFIGGELVDLRDTRVTGTDFYNSIKNFGVLKGIYRKAEAGFFDIYEQGKKLFRLSWVFQYLHNGVLPTYLVWMLLGMMGLFFVLAR